MKVNGIPYIQGRNYSRNSDGSPRITKKYAVAIHNTSNDATAEGEASYATRRADNVSAHFYVDHDSIIQSLDTSMRAWHSGSNEGNNNSIAVEITGVNAWTRDQWLKRVAWEKLGRALAIVCLHHNIPPVRCSTWAMTNNPRIRGFYGHNDMRQAWGGTSHTDPGPNFPWDHLFNAVEAVLNPPQPAPTPEVHNVQHLILAREEDKPEVYIGDGLTRRHIKNEQELAGVQYWVKRKGGDPTVHLFKPGTIDVIGLLIV